MGTIIKEGLECGFTNAAEIDPATIECKQAVRDMCAACKAYGHSWICPPACGEIDECQRRISGYSRGVIVQTTGELEDEFDGEAMMETAAKHGNSVQQFYEHLLKQYSGDEVLALGAGGCNRCQEVGLTCTYPDEPCRFPDGRISSMEAYGIFISELCQLNGITYNYGRNTITYVSCYLFK